MHALRSYRSEVESMQFPAKAHTTFLASSTPKHSNHSTSQDAGVWDLDCARFQKIAVIGGGAMGSFMSARLSSHAPIQQITAWQEHFDSVNANGEIKSNRIQNRVVFQCGNFLIIQSHFFLPGLQVTELDGTTHTIRNVTAITRDGSGLTQAGGWADLVLVCVKAPQTAQAASTAARIVAKDGVVLTLQNGWNVDEIAKVGFVKISQKLPFINSDYLFICFFVQVIPRSRLFVGTTSHGAEMIRPGCVVHRGNGTTLLAPTVAHNRSTEEIARTLVQLLSRSGIPTLFDSGECLYA
jgi:ketopantoate reductase